MATFEKRSGHWRAKIVRKGRKLTATFPTKSQAVEWARKVEAEIVAGHYGITGTQWHTLADAVEKFRLEVSPTRRGARWEDLRLSAFARRETRLCARPLSSLDESSLAEWRDRRLLEVSPATVRREMALLGSVLRVALREWRWLARNPLAGIAKPSSPPARRRGVSNDEIAAIVKACGHDGAGLEVARAFCLSIETAMRAGEILGLTLDHVDLQRRVVTLPKTKNGDSRQVPLSTKAVNILDSLPKHGEETKPAGVLRAFTLSPATLDVLFRRARSRAIADCPSVATVRFHDARSEAITRLSRKVDVLQLARIVGHRDLRSPMFYYSESAEEIAKKLD